MDPGTMVLLHSPVARASTWGDVPALLRTRGYDVLVVDVTDDDEPPYAATYVARTAQQVAATAPRPPLCLVGHSGAGPLLPQIGFAQRAAHRPVGAYVFIDATLPRPGASRLALLHGDDEDLAHRVREELERGASVPRWSEDDLAVTGLGPAERRIVLDAARPRPLAYYQEEVPHPSDWPDAPCGYLQTSPAYESAARIAGRRGWVVTAVDGGHFAALVQPARLADALIDVVTRL